MSELLTGYESLSAETCDLCIVGAGVAGLNALFVAALYLPKTARVFLIDRNRTCGGMWTETYGYVRLHQPHQMFTVGDIPWALDRPSGYLATGREVQDHLAYCLDILRKQVNLVELYGFVCESCLEFATPEGPRTLIHCRRTGGETHTIKAERTIFAEGWNIPVMQPLHISSRQVISTTPNRLAKDETDTTAPAIIVGGGKTGMDTALELLRRHPRRRISLINGEGTVFGNRDLLFPRGLRRWWQGTMVSTLSRDVVMRYDGTNAEAVYEYFRRTYSISPDGLGGQFFFSTQSRAEADEIRAGLHEIVSGYLEDVVDTDIGPMMTFRDGRRLPLPRGSLVINCSGHLLRHPRPYEPYVTPLGSMVRVTSRSSVYFLSTTAAYLLTHLFFLGKLRELPLYELDMDSLKQGNGKVFFLTCLTQSFLNMLVIMANVPIGVFARCGADLNRWYPLPRRLLALAQLRVHQKRYEEHCRNTLDRLRCEHGVRCGRLDMKDQIASKRLKYT